MILLLLLLLMMMLTCITVSIKKVVPVINIFIFDKANILR